MKAPIGCAVIGYGPLCGPASVRLSWLPVVLAAASALVAYLAQVQFHFDTIVTSFFIFICFALISDFEVERNEPVLLFSSQKLTVPMALAAGAVFVIGAGWQIEEIVVNAMVGLTSL